VVSDSTSSKEKEARNNEEFVEKELNTER